MRIFVISTVDLKIQNAQRTHLLEKWNSIAMLGNEVYLWSFGWDDSNENSLPRGIRFLSAWHIPVEGLMDISYQLFLFLSLITWMIRKSPT